MVLQFDNFQLNVPARKLQSGGEDIHVNARYFDALVLLASNADRVVERQELLEQVWGDTVVGEEALTQCIAALRRALNDSPASPKYIRTVPRRGYQFVGTPVQTHHFASLRNESGFSAYWPLLGGGLAGVIGGLAFGVILALSPNSPGFSATVAVMLVANIVLGALAALAITLGFVVANNKIAYRSAGIAGAAAGGAAIGAVVHWLAQQTFLLLLGKPLTGVTGTLEGVILGAFVGVGLYLSGRKKSVTWAITAAAAGLGGVLIYWVGGHLMAGSLGALATAFESTPVIYPQVGSADSIGTTKSALHAIVISLEAACFGAGVGWGFGRLNAN